MTYVMLGSFVCLMNMTIDRFGWIEARTKPKEVITGYAPLLHW